MILQVGPEEAGARLDVFLSEKTDLTRSAAQKLAADGVVRVNGKAASKNLRLKAGDVVRHGTFGVGVVQKVTPMGNDSLLEIRFEGVGVKKIMNNFAKLTKT